MNRDEVSVELSDVAYEMPDSLLELLSTVLSLDSLCDRFGPPCNSA